MASKPNLIISLHSPLENQLMKRLIVACLIALGAVMCASDDAKAQHPGAFGFAPFGFYQPYGARYGSSIQTPPYFALNPPVYYGSRHARPYGMSPFASPPLVSAPATYKGRLESTFHQPARPLSSGCCNNPYLSSKNQQSSSNQMVETKGKIKANPFVVGSGEQLVSF